MPFTPNRFLRSFLLICSFLAVSQIQAQSICDENRQGQVIITPKSKVELDVICGCTGISNLWFKKILVTNLPTCFAGLDSLTSLSFSKSEMARIPDEVFQMKNLQALDLSYTPIYVLPPEITKLKNLVSLDLKYTFVETLPEGLEFIRSIDMRYIDMNHENQKALKEQYPTIEFHFSSPCNCN